MNTALNFLWAAMLIFTFGLAAWIVAACIKTEDDPMLEPLTKEENDDDRA